MKRESARRAPRTAGRAPIVPRSPGRPRPPSIPCPGQLRGRRLFRRAGDCALQQRAGLVPLVVLGWLLLGTGLSCYYRLRAPDKLTPVGPSLTQAQEPQAIMNEQHLETV